MRITGNVIPENILRLMPEHERRRFGAAGLTQQEREDRNAHKREAEMQGRIVSLLAHAGITANWSRTDKRKTDLTGWPDLTFGVRPASGGPAIACALEVKLPGRGPSVEQVRMLAKLQREGWVAAIIYSEAEAMEVVKRIRAL